MKYKTKKQGVLLINFGWKLRDCLQYSPHKNESKITYEEMKRFLYEEMEQIVRIIPEHKNDCMYCILAFMTIRTNHVSAEKLCEEIEKMLK